MQVMPESQKWYWCNFIMQVIFAKAVIEQYSMGGVRRAKGIRARRKFDTRMAKHSVSEASSTGNINPRKDEKRKRKHAV